MRNILELGVTAVLLSLYSIAACAGSPGGLEVITLANAKGGAYAADISAFFERFDHDAHASYCENAQLNISGVYKKNGSKGINSELALSATQDRKQRSLLGHMMTAFRDKNHPRGFDAALVYDVKNDALLIYGISADSDTKVYASVLPLADLTDKKKVDAAICHALVNIPVLAEP
jgi:hypothetical protein